MRSSPLSAAMPIVKVKDAAAPMKAVGALCFEDLIFEWVEPPPVEKEVAAFSSFAFNVRPDPEATTRAAGRRPSTRAQPMTAQSTWRPRATAPPRTLTIPASAGRR